MYQGRGPSAYTDAVAWEVRWPPSLTPPRLTCQRHISHCASMADRAHLIFARVAEASGSRLHATAGRSHSHFFSSAISASSSSSFIMTGVGGQFEPA